MKISDKVIVALDNMAKDEAFSFLESNLGHVKLVKVGMELFYRYHLELLYKINQRFHIPIFLDLKLHDIPNTVAKAIHSLKGAPVKFLTIHLSGGKKMLEAAHEARLEALPTTQILGVTYLTSLSEADTSLLWNLDRGKMLTSMKEMISLAKDCHIDGLILSGADLAGLADYEDARSLIKVCPGIRFEDESAKQDQKRVFSPEKAIEQGADYLVIGRSLTQSANIGQRWQQLSNTD